MFASIEQLDAHFRSGRNGSVESIIECNRSLLSRLVRTAAGTNYWISKHALNILQRGVDMQDVAYIELLTNEDWILLSNAPHSKAFPAQHQGSITGWAFDLLQLAEQPDLLELYLQRYDCHREAILAVARQYLPEIVALVPAFDAQIWQFLVQVRGGAALAVAHLHCYSKSDRKKIQAYLACYSSSWG
jgi:hypothetical protein